MSDIEDSIPEVENLSLSDETNQKNKVIDGRSFNNEKDVAYILPNDDDEAGRLNFQHRALNLHKAPLEEKLVEGIDVIDAGCGPATWTIEMGKTYPNSKFTGLDISFIDSNTKRPDNVDFNTCNIARDIPFEDDSVDFYHQRLLMAGLNEEDMKKTLKNAYRVLKPGGYIELCEANTETLENQGPIYKQYNSIVNGIFKKKGLITDMGDCIEGFLKESGLENIYFEKVCLPINHTNKAGELLMANFTEMGNSLKPVLAMVNPAFEDAEVYRKYIESIEEECRECETNIYFCYAYGQKPLEE
ncbi:S-adenosyl-L-methionine-dependent methyltransferase [Pilobolus umbonatus]|nr:S-adenosyl-L-methionine-dependent methyltransferase [Pilobolus umbonatus]